MRNSRFAKVISIALPVLLSFIVLSRWITPVFQINDDMTIRSILKGDYTGTPDGHAIYMLYPLSGLLSLLYRVMNLPWMELAFAGCILVAVYIILSGSRHKAIGFVLCITLIYPLYFLMHYTAIAALLAGTAIFLIYRDKMNYGIPLLWLLSYMIRKEVALLCLPFLGVAFLWRICLTDRKALKEEAKAYASVLHIAGIGVLLCILINGLMYSSEEWKDFNAYNESRVALYDFTDFIPSEYYKTHCEEFGMTQDQYHIWTTYNILLDKELDTPKMQQLATDVTAYMKENRDSVEWLKTCVKSYLTHLRYEQFPYNLFCIAGYGVVAFLAMRKKDWKHLLLLCAMGVGRNVICIYLLYQGRFPNRISLALYLIELLSLWGQINSISSYVPFAKKTLWRKIGFVGTLMILSLTGQFVLQNTWKQSQTALVYQRQWENIKDYCEQNTDNLYLGYTFSLQEYPGIPYEDTVSNLYLLGCWTANSPLTQSLWEEYGSEDAAQALVRNRNVRLLVEENRDIEHLKTYFANRFGEVALEPMGQIVCDESKKLIDYRISLLH